MPGAVAAVVATVRVAEEPAVTLPGLTVAVTPAGAPLTVRLTLCAEPETTVVPTVAVAEEPAVTEPVAGLTPTEKSLPGWVLDTFSV